MLPAAAGPAVPPAAAGLFIFMAGFFMGTSAAPPGPPGCSSSGSSLPSDSSLCSSEISSLESSSPFSASSASASSLSPATIIAPSAPGMATASSGTMSAEFAAAGRFDTPAAAGRLLTPGPPCPPPMPRFLSSCLLGCAAMTGRMMISLLKQSRK